LKAKLPEDVMESDTKDHTFGLTKVKESLHEDELTPSKKMLLEVVGLVQWE